MDPYAPLSSPDPEDEGASHTSDEHEISIGKAEMHLLSTSTEAHTNRLEELTVGALDPPSTNETLLPANVSYHDDGFVDVHERHLDEEVKSAGCSPQSQRILATAAGNLDFVLNPVAGLSPIQDPSLETFQPLPDTTHNGVHISNEGPNRNRRSVQKQATRQLSSSVTSQKSQGDGTFRF